MFIFRARSDARAVDIPNSAATSDSVECRLQASRKATRLLVTGSGPRELPSFRLEVPWFVDRDSGFGSLTTMHAPRPFVGFTILHPYHKLVYPVKWIVEGGLTSLVIMAL